MDLVKQVRGHLSPNSWDIPALVVSGYEVEHGQWPLWKMTTEYNKHGGYLIIASKLTCMKYEFLREILGPVLVLQFLNTNYGKGKNGTSCFAYFCWQKCLSFGKFMTIWKIFEKSFKWDVAGLCRLILLDMA